MTEARAVGTKGMPREEREAQIVDAATEEFGRHGYGGASMVEIARAAADYQQRLDEFAMIGATQLMNARGLTDGRDIEAIALVWTGVVDSLISWWIRRLTSKGVTTGCGRSRWTSRGISG